MAKTQFGQFWSLLALGCAAWCATPAFADSVTITTTYETVWIDETESGPGTPANAIARFGPFNITDSQTAQMTGTVDSHSPAAFRQMLVAYPGINRLEMLDCPGTVDDEANLALARMVRSAGIATHVPSGGSVRSGAVELFLAGVRRTAAPDAEFVVHSWIDEDGLQADDFPPGDPVHQSYLAFYRTIGLSADKAAAFYALTNSVPHEDALVLTPRDMADYGLIDGNLALDFANLTT